MNPPDPVFQFQLASAICSSIAIASTGYRLFMRRTKFWVDDGFACCSMIVLCVQIAAVFSPLTTTNGVTRYYLMITAFYAITWFSRVSILLSIIRIDPSKLRRRLLLNAGILFFAVCAFLIAQLYWICEPQDTWRLMRVPQCTLTQQVAICQLVFDTLADLLLLIVPLQLLIVLQDRWLRSRLMMIFSTCMFTTIVSLVHAIFILTLRGPEIVIVALVESSVSLVVCNVPVIATALLNLGEHSPPRLESSSNSNSNSPLSAHFLSSRAPSHISGTVLLGEPLMTQHEPRTPGIPARPSSVLLKPEDATLRGSQRGS